MLFLLMPILLIFILVSLVFFSLFFSDCFFARVMSRLYEWLDFSFPFPGFLPYFECLGYVCLLACLLPFLSHYLLLQCDFHPRGRRNISNVFSMYRQCIAKQRILFGCAHSFVRCSFHPSLSLSLSLFLCRFPELVDW